MEKIKLRAYDNLAYWFQISQKEAMVEIEQCLDRNESDEMTNFWFYRSIALQRNTNGIPFENQSHHGATTYLEQALDDYWISHAAINNLSTSWIGFDMRANIDIRTAEGFNAVKSKNSSPYWIDYAFRFQDYLDIFMYPCNPTNINRDRFFSAVLANYMLNNADDIIEVYKNTIIEGIKNDVFVDSLFRSVSLQSIVDDRGRLNKYIAMNYMFSKSGIKKLLSGRQMQDLDIVQEARRYFKTNGFVFSKSTPKLPYGFDIMLASLGYHQESTPIGLWSRS